MLCAVYKSLKKQQTYLFVKKRDDFSDVPEALKTIFGTPSLVTIVNLATKDKLAMADIDKVKVSLASDGYYLQLPPPEEDMLKTHKAQMDKLVKSKEQLDEK
ncbi:YcgL domain-containing protein [Thalassotalea sp. PLHSN55]|uniref:YcgL domain-containing protein n=1 Tax=Thalassotalea sp. PLHSN55 TaxID=3435888 RepID=UPI003F84AC15